MNVLVTGGAGFIGSHLAERLLAAGHEVTIVDNLTTGRRENVPEGAEFIADNIATRLFWALEREQESLIVHCAASYADPNKWHTDTETNVQGAINVAIAARETGARVVYFQTALIYSQKSIDGPPGAALPTWFPIDPQNSYAISKYAAEQYLRLSDVPLLVLRLANIYGPRNLSGPIPTFYKRISEGQRCTVAATRRDFVYIHDLCDLVMQMIKAEATGTYNVSSGSDVPIGQVYDAVLDAMDAYGHLEAEYIPPQPDDARSILLDPTETQRDFSWVATTELDEGVMEAVAWYREHGVERTYTHLREPVR